MYNVIGWFGMILFVVNYFLLAEGKVQSTSRIYNVGQVLAAAAIAISLLPAKAWPTIILELFFVVIGLRAMIAKNG